MCRRPTPSPAPESKSTSAGSSSRARSFHSRSTSVQSTELSSMLHLYDQIAEATATIRKAWGKKPHAGIILGTGLGGLVDRMQIEASLDYDTIPHFLKSSVASHAGQLVCGTL